jgi:hypothetical protein
MQWDGREQAMLQMLCWALLLLFSKQWQTAVKEAQLCQAVCMQAQPAATVTAVAATSYRGSC